MIKQWAANTGTWIQSAGKWVFGWFSRDNFKQVEDVVLDVVHLIDPLIPQAIEIVGEIEEKLKPLLSDGTVPTQDIIADFIRRYVRNDDAAIDDLSVSVRWLPKRHMLVDIAVFLLKRSGGGTSELALLKATIEVAYQSLLLIRSFSSQDQTNAKQ